MYEKKYILLCLVCGGLSITLGGLFIGIYFILRCFTSSLYYFETIPTYVPAVLLILTGLLVLCFVKRANRHAYLLKLSGAFCLISSVLCVVITITTTVIHMNRLQTLKECVYSQQSRTCTCYAGVDSTVDADEANSKYIFGDTQDCEIIHGILYSCLRALFGLSVLGILVCIFSAMLVYQLLTHEKKKLYWEQLETRRRFFSRQIPQYPYANYCNSANCDNLSTRQWNLLDNCCWSGPYNPSDNADEYCRSSCLITQRSPSEWPNFSGNSGVYHWSRIPNYADGCTYNECHLSSSGYERPSPLKAASGYHEYASIPNYSLGPPPPYSNSNSVENLFPGNSPAVFLSENLVAVSDKNGPSTTAEIHSQVRNITVPCELPPSTLHNEACAGADHPRSRTAAALAANQRLAYPPRSLPARRRRKNNAANAKCLEQLSAVSLQNLNEMFTRFQRVRELKRSLAAEQNVLQALVRSMRDKARVDADPSELSEIFWDRYPEIYFDDDDSSQSGRDSCYSPEMCGRTLTEQCPVENQPLPNDASTASVGVYSEVSSPNSFHSQHPWMWQNSDRAERNDRWNANKICVVPERFSQLLRRERMSSDSCSCQFWLRGSLKNESKKYSRHLSRKKSSMFPDERFVDADAIDYPPLSSQSCREIMNPRYRSIWSVRGLDLDKIFLSCSDLRKRVAGKNRRNSSWSQIVFLQSLVDNLYKNNLTIRDAHLSRAKEVKSEPHSPAKDKLQKINPKQTRNKMNSTSINV